MAAQHIAALEGEEQVLADCLDREQSPPVESLGDPRGGRPGMGCLDLDPLPDERLEPPGRPMESVALGH